MYKTNITILTVIQCFINGHYSKIVVRLKIFTAMKIQIVVFRVLTTCRNVVRYQHFRGPCCLHHLMQDGDSKVLQSTGILPHHYTISEHRRPQTETKIDK